MYDRYSRWGISVDGESMFSSDCVVPTFPSPFRLGTFLLCLLAVHTSEHVLFFFFTVFSFFLFFLFVTVDSITSFSRHPRPTRPRGWRTSVCVSKEIPAQGFLLCTGISSMRGTVAKPHHSGRENKERLVLILMHKRSFYFRSERYNIRYSGRFTGHA